ncbi:hypothetical protein AHF37_06302 [Paragonimus kellicotti]|nr:hypothetical protein AHF37_06302 [Paragonimus kellicotti]
MPCHFFHPMSLSPVTRCLPLHSSRSAQQVLYLLLHWEKGSPYETLDQGEARALTQWEQFDDGEQFSPTKKFLIVVPIVLFLLASFYTEYDPVHCLINASSLIFLALLPKLPQFYRVRIFGINRW